MNGFQRNEISVKIDPQWLRHRDSDLIAARIPGLGLTAYGQTEEDARRNLVDALHDLVQSFHRYGILEQRLNESGIDWDWVDPKPGWIEMSSTDRHRLDLTPA